MRGYKGLTFPSSFHVLLEQLFAWGLKKIRQKEEESSPVKGHRNQFGYIQNCKKPEESLEEKLLEFPQSVFLRSAP